MNAPISSPSLAGSSASSSTQQSPTNAQSSQSVPMLAPVQIKAPSTETFLRDVNLVAEAAKRAQLACLTRDFEDCGL
ncbi:uncharacterized protein G6M90_00g076240 [Metarhizium brunneum]|uniref:Uncharacterized protein n=1 Tax=Metarhizium brunneum TaxID=500148 RepID=A0A7D5V030_9HYPO